jgi:cytochrome P450
MATTVGGRISRGCGRKIPFTIAARARTARIGSVTRHADIKTVDTGNLIYSSEARGITIGDQDSVEEIELDNFISMDEPRHSLQRKTVAPSVAPQNLMLLNR